MTLRAMFHFLAQAVSAFFLPNNAWKQKKASSKLFVFLLRFDHDWNVRIRFFPQREEILIRLTSFGYVTLQRRGARQAQMRKRVNWRSRLRPSVVDYLLKFGRGLDPLFQIQG